MKKIKINFLDFYLFSVPVQFDLAWIKILFSNHLIVKLEYGGKIGIGEGVLYKTSLLKTQDLLQKEFQKFFQQQFLGFKQARNKLFETFSLYPGVVCAFDLALWDLEGKIRKKPLYQLLGKQKRKKIEIAQQIFIPQNKIELLNKVKKIISQKTKTIKLKVGRNQARDILNIKLIKEISKDSLDIQVDLNQALDFKQAVLFGKEIHKSGVIAWEEPMKFTHFAELRELKRKVKIPIILDESISTLEFLQRAINNKAIDILNLKFSRLGGLTNILQLIKVAKRNKIGLEIGCSEELGIGTLAQLHLASFLTNLRLMEAFGPERLGFDLIKEKLKIRNGQLKAPSRKSGLGVNFDLGKLRRVARKNRFFIINKSNAQACLPFYTDYFKTMLKSKLINGYLFLKKTELK